MNSSALFDAGLFDAGLQPERTDLAWQRSTLSVVVSSLIPLPAILDRMARGVRNDDIAVRMGISIKTVQNNISSILLELGAADRAPAVTIARETGLGLRR